ncbi:anti-sigma factor family protein [Sorangium sp. So ce1335]|uniref:anti-sigma factor family protein n=1 Tax=Sorangium sp. So ce1335 TaxID=3133335 RepID=UPI003F5F0956
MSTANSSKANHGEASAPPTDLELMLYVDGELDEARHRQVEAYVRHDPRCRAKVAGLVTAADMIRDGALASSAADSIADAVMAKIQAEPAVAAKIQVAPVAAARADGGAAAQPRAASSSGEATRSPAPLRGSPANDNARGIFALTAIAVAAAAALMVWGRMDAEAPSASLPAPTVPEVLAPAPLATVSEPAALPSAEGEVQPGVEIATVDFGARMGTIFYVPREAVASGPTTTVVWLSDDGPGGQ